MTGQSDDKKSAGVADRVAQPSAAGQTAPVVPATAATVPAPAGGVAASSRDVTEDVARVVNLLQRLDKLHSKSPEREAVTRPPAAAPPAPRAPGTDGLSSLSGSKSDRVSRASQNSPVAYLVPPALPPAQPPSIPALPPAGGPKATEAAVSTEAAPFIKSPGRSTPAPSPAPPRSKPDRAPVALIASVIAGVAALGSWGLYNFQGGQGRPGIAALAPGGEIPASTHARLDAVALVTQPKPEGTLVPGCGTVAITSGQSALTLTVFDPARGGQPLSIDVGELNFKTAFQADGRLRLRAPLLTSRPAVRWSGLGGANCEQVATLSADSPLLQIAVVWSASAALDLHVIEPNGWFGGPSGHVSNIAPNTDKARGAGAVDTFATTPDATRVHVYAVDPARIPPGSILNAFVKPAPAVDRPACEDGVQPPPMSEVQYQVQILRSGTQAGFQREIQSFSMQLPTCGSGASETDRSERIMVRN